MMSFLKKSLELKVTVATALILMTLFGLSTAAALWVDTSGTYTIVFRDLDTLADVVQKSLIKDMRDGRGTDVQKIIEDVGTEEGIESVRIFDEDGTILKSADRAEIGKGVDAALLEAYHAGTTQFVSEQGGARVFNAIQPIANAPQCFGCHPSEKKVNGVLYLGYSLGQVQDHLFRHFAMMLGLFFATILSVGLGITLLLKKTVNDPINRMKAAMEQVKAGDLDVSIPVGSEDEIGVLQKSFNDMLARIKGLVAENLEQQKDIVEKEQELKMRETLAEKNRALEDAYREIVDKNRYYMEMLSFISHEFKNPLVVLKGYSTLLQSEELGGLTDRQLDALRAMDKSADTLHEMIANYLDLSRIERGELTLELRRVDLGEEVIKPLIAEYSRALGKASMSLRVTGVEGPVEIVADPGLLKSAVGNLISNAIKYGWPDTEVLLEVRPEENGLRLSVFNEGYGIPDDDLVGIFDRFTRLDTEATRAKKGSGLGLCIVKEIIRMHGGEIWAESKEGEWAKLVMKLPARPPSGREEPGVSV